MTESSDETQTFDGVTRYQVNRDKFEGKRVSFTNLLDKDNMVSRGKGILKILEHDGVGVITIESVYGDRKQGGHFTFTLPESLANKLKLAESGEFILNV